MPYVIHGTKSLQVLEITQVSKNLSFCVKFSKINRVKLMLAPKISLFIHQQIVHFFHIFLVDKNSPIHLFPYQPNLLRNSGRFFIKAKQGLFVKGIKQLVNWF